MGQIVIKCHARWVNILLYFATSSNKQFGLFLRISIYILRCDTDWFDLDSPRQLFESEFKWKIFYLMYLFPFIVNFNYPEKPDQRNYWQILNNLELPRH
jgi:hypothetical protein